MIAPLQLSILMLADHPTGTGTGALATVCQALSVRADRAAIFHDAVP